MCLENVSCFRSSECGRRGGKARGTSYTCTTMTCAADPGCHVCVMAVAAGTQLGISKNRRDSRSDGDGRRDKRDNGSEHPDSRG